MMDSIDKWCKEYDIEPIAIEVMNAWINQQTLGITYFKRSLLPG